MLNKILLTCFFIHLELSDCESNFLVSKNYQNNLTYCITDDNNYAISWISTYLEEIPQQVSSYIPEPSKKGKLSYQPTTSKAWSLQRNMSDQQILDRRWEEFPLIMVKNKGYTLLHANLKKNFDVHFSIRTDDARIYLCDGSTLSTSKCHSMILKNENNLTKIRCLGNIYYILEPSPDTYISLNYWSHFHLSKENNKLTLWYDKEEYWYAILDGSVINMTHLIVSSESEKSFWKIHEVEYLYTTIEGSDLFWDDLSTTTENPRICLSYSVFLCESCQLILTLKRKDEIVSFKIVGETTAMQWVGKLYYSDDLPVGNYTLVLTTIGGFSARKHFWAIDGMRECRENGFRILQSNKETKCQLMSGQRDVISIENAVLTEFVQENYCSNNAFELGHKCVPLRWLYYSEDDEMQFCSPDKNRTICYYKRGFYSYKNSVTFMFVFLATSILVASAGLATYFFCLRRYCRRNNIKPSETLLNNIENVQRREIITYERKQNTTVPLNEFMVYVKNCEKNKELEQQHKAIIEEYSLRVQYEEMKKGEYFDYIDMVYTKGKTVRKSYIATELLSKNIAKDFWKIVWNDNVRHIVLQKDYNKQQYWPEKGVKMECDEISVQLIYSKADENFHYRKFILTREDKVKEVEQIQFPYNGTNHRKYVPLFKRLQEFSLTPNKPILVHSSNGIGMVGLILLCDMSLRMAEEENVIDVWKNLQELAKHNINFAGTVVQYQFAHSIISEYFSGENYYEDPEQVYLNY